MSTVPARIEHLKDQTDDGEFKCQFCKQTYASNLTLTQHKQRAHRETLFVCPTANCRQDAKGKHTKFTDVAMFLAHISRYHCDKSTRESLACCFEDCEATYSQRGCKENVWKSDKLKKHFASAHGTEAMYQKTQEFYNHHNGVGVTSATPHTQVSDTHESNTHDELPVRARKRLRNT